MTAAQHTPGPVFHARGFMVGVKLLLSPAIRNEWESRCIGDVIPALRDYAGERAVLVDRSTLAEIKADCEFYVDPKAVDAAPGERAAYRALLKQCAAIAQATGSQA